MFWIVDNASDHRGQKSIDHPQGRWRNLILVRLPVHASWLNQVEIYHSIIQRKVLDPNDLQSSANTLLLVELADRLGLTEALSEAVAPSNERRSAHDPGVFPRDFAVAIADGGSRLRPRRAAVRGHEYCRSVITERCRSWEAPASASSADRKLLQLRPDRANLEEAR